MKRRRELHRPVPGHGVMAAWWLGGVFLLCADNAGACTRLLRHDHFTGQVTVRNEIRPDIALTAWLGNSADTGGRWVDCGRSRDIGIRFVPLGRHLKFERVVVLDGQDFPAYSWSDTSPLLVFSLSTNGSSGGEARRAPVSMDAATQMVAKTGTADMDVRLVYKLVSRGKPMNGGEAIRMWGFSSLPDESTLSTMRHVHELTVIVPELPCELSDAALVLPAVNAMDLAREGQTAMTRDINVRMRCPSGGGAVSLVLEDLHGSTGRPGELTPTADSGAAGVSLRVLRDDRPVALGTAWDHAPREAGDSLIRFSAQYIRNAAPLQIGTLRAEARLTATYR